MPYAMDVYMPYAMDVYNKERKQGIIVWVQINENYSSHCVTEDEFTMATSSW